jgi:hypothetical protein
MDMNDQSTASSLSQVNKKKYEKPSFRHEQVFVTTALSCGKVNPQAGGSCPGNSSAS